MSSSAVSSLPTAMGMQAFVQSTNPKPPSVTSEYNDGLVFDTKTKVLLVATFLFAMIGICFLFVFPPIAFASFCAAGASFLTLIALKVIESMRKTS